MARFGNHAEGRSTGLRPTIRVVRPPGLVKEFGDLVSGQKMIQGDPGYDNGDASRVGPTHLGRHVVHGNPLCGQ